jgi:hypothetical protein
MNLKFFSKLLIFTLIFNYTSLIIIDGDFHFCPTYQPDKCFKIETIEIKSTVRQQYCTQYIECLFIHNDKVTIGYLIDNYIIVEYSHFIDCNMPSSKTLYNNENRLLIQRQNFSLNFINLSNDNKINSDNILNIFSLIVNIITLALFSFILVKQRKVNISKKDPLKTLSISNI